MIKFHLLSNIISQDFGDDGEFYQGQLNCATRYILEHPDRYKLNSAELALRRIDKTGPTARANIERGDMARRLLANSDTCGQHSEAEIARHAALRDWERIWTVVSDSYARSKFTLSAICRHRTLGTTRNSMITRSRSASYYTFWSIQMTKTRLDDGAPQI